MNLFIAFLGGIITFVSPCILPLIPVYLAYISGVSFQELSAPGSKKPFLRIFLSSLLFVLGFTFVFTLLAALFYIFAQFLGQYKVWFDRVAGVILVVLGLNMAGLVKIGFLNFEAKYNKEIKRRSLLSSFLIGMAFGAGWTPCIGPILSGILFTSAASANVLGSILLLVAYSLGLGIPFILTGLITNKFLSLFTFIKKHYRIVETVGGVFLILLGALLILNGVGALSGWLSKLLPGIADIEKNLVR